MSQSEAENMVTIVRHWWAHVWAGGNTQERDAIILHTNGCFIAMNVPIRLGRGWQPYDPVIRVNNHCHRYASVAAWAAGQADGGVTLAQTFRAWYSSNLYTLDNLPEHLQALAVITHLAEVGRGYVSALDIHLYPWINDICNAANAQDAQALWQDYGNRFPPSLTYAQDLATEYGS